MKTAADKGENYSLKEYVLLKRVDILEMFYRVCYKLKSLKQERKELRKELKNLNPSPQRDK